MRESPSSAEDGRLRALLESVGPVTIVGHDVGNVAVRPGSAIPALALHAEFERLAPGLCRIHGINNDQEFDAALDDIEASRTLLINGLGFFQVRPFKRFLEAAKGRSLFSLLHETAFAIEAAEGRHPSALRTFWRNLGQINVLFSTHRQAEWLRGITACTGTVVYNAIIVSPDRIPLPSRALRSRPRIVNVATIQERKGPRLFDAVARLAADRGLDLEFVWIGRRTQWIDDDFEFSGHVRWIDHLSPDEVLDALADSDVFFLASVDDPLPLSITEAVHQGCRAVSYVEPGCSEVLQGRTGYASFSRYSAEDALKAIQSVLRLDHRDIDFSPVIEAFSPPAYARRVIEAMSKDHATAVYPGPSSAFEWVRPYRKKIESLVAARRLSEAEVLLRFVDRATAEFEPAEVLRGRILLARGDAVGAREHAQKAIEYNPRSWVAHQFLGDIHVRTRCFVDAALSFASAIDLTEKTDDLDVKLKSAVDASLQTLSAHSGSIDAIRPDYARLGALAGRFPEIVEHYGRRLRKEGHLHEALAQFTRATRLAPTRTINHLERGALAAAVGDVALAEAAYKRALELNPKSVAARTGLGSLSRSRPLKRLFPGWW